MNKIPFDISFKERIERGEVKVVTRDNREVTIIKWDLKGNYPIVACVKVEVCNYEGDESWFEERPYAFSKEGKRYKGFPEDKSDIFILVEEPVNEDLDIAIGEYCSNPDNFITYIDVASGFRSKQKDDIPLIIKAIKFGANWKKQQLMKNVVLETEVLRDSDGDGVDTPYESWLTLANTEIPDLPESLGLREGDKVKVIIIKKD